MTQPMGAAREGPRRCLGSGGRGGSVRRGRSGSAEVGGGTGAGADPARCCGLAWRGGAGPGPGGAVALCASGRAERGRVSGGGAAGPGRAGPFLRPSTSTSSSSSFSAAGPSAAPAEDARPAVSGGGAEAAARGWRAEDAGRAASPMRGRMGTQGSPVKSYDYLLKFLLVGDSDVGKGEILESLQDGASESPYAYSNGKGGWGKPGRRTPIAVTPQSLSPPPTSAVTRIPRGPRGPYPSAELTGWEGLFCFFLCFCGFFFFFYY